MHGPYTGVLHPSVNRDHAPRRVRVTGRSTQVIIKEIAEKHEPVEQLTVNLPEESAICSRYVTRRKGELLV